MPVIAAYSVKGGVGKTTLAVNLSWSASQASGLNTLLWDLDAASGAAFLLGAEPAADKSARRVFASDRDPTQ